MTEPSWLDRSRGYLDLAMFEEAWRELDALPDDKRHLPDTHEMRIVIRLDEGRVEEALALCGVLCSLHPENHAGFIQGAYCLHALGRTEDAIEHLQSGPETLRDEPVYFYNLACYELALGKRQAAIAWVRQSIEMDRRYRERAEKDPDLAAIRDEI
ncbi:MAG TPA: tetratricopeptide repeat protein [Bacteroidia bacterium]|nr:tetratricopeptide repeat protein [Bacteroidia bacterium]